MSEMPQLENNTIQSDSNFPHCSRIGRPRRIGKPVHWYGWDSRTQTWHGPNELGKSSTPNRRLALALESALGGSWYGPLSCCSSGEPGARFFALIHDLSDCAVASIYCHDSKVGPAEIVAVIPPSRRAKLREEFAFDFVSFARFLGSLGEGAELQVHEAITSAIAEQDGSGALVFSISSGLWPSDFEHVLSRCVEKVALTLCQWQEGRGTPQ